MAVSKNKTIKNLQETSVDLVVVINRITDRYQSDVLRPSRGDISMAKRYLKWLLEDIEIVEEQSELDN